MKKTKAAIAAILLVCFSFTACTQSQVTQAENLTAVLLQDVPPILEILAGAGVLAPATLTKAQAAAGQATADFSLAQTLIKDYQALPSVTTAQKIDAALSDATTNLNAILTAARVLNPQKVQTIQGAITLMLNTVAQVEAVFPTTASVSAVKASNKIKLPSAKSFQKKFHSILGQ